MTHEQAQELIEFLRAFKMCMIASVVFTGIGIVAGGVLFCRSWLETRKSRKQRLENARHNLGKFSL